MTPTPKTARTHSLAAIRRLLTGGRPRPQAAETRRLRRRRHVHPAIGLVRAIAGWALILLGFILIVLPIVPGFFLIPIGVLLVGRDSFLIRITRVGTKLLLRKAETWRGLLGRIGRKACDAERSLSKKLRERRLRRWLEREAQEHAGTSSA